MKISLYGYLILTVGIVFAIFFSTLQGIVGISYEKLPGNIENHKLFHGSPISDSLDHLMWFIQVSDLHISIFQDRQRINDLQYLCETAVDIIKPSVVVASGDLTDAKESNSVGSHQIIDEWKIYKNILTKCKPLERIKWLDVRGNHDNFDVPGAFSERNLFQNYSMVKEPFSYSYTVTAKGGSVYTFIAIDACPNQGLRRPFNFIGLISTSEVDRIRDIIKKHNSSNYFIWFGHYPTSCILSESEGVRSLIGSDVRSLVYLCGHLHTLGGLVPNMYTHQKEGFSELELADWKDNRMYRLMAIDHGLLSFVDVRNKEWPVILVTNPRNSLIKSLREPTENILNSTHIRILVFSNEVIKDVEVLFNDVGLWQKCSHVSGPLYVLPWKPSSFSEGIHDFFVRVADSSRPIKIMRHSFSLDGTATYRIGLIARICLMTNMSSVSQLLFGAALLFCIIPVCALRFMDHQILGTRKINGSLIIDFFHIWIVKIWITSKVDQTFYPLIFYPLYIAVGPWCFGELIRGHYGFLFSWGSFINGTFLPGSFTYTHAFFQLALFYYPLLMCISHIVYKRMHRGRFYQQLSFYSCQIALICLLFSQLYITYYFWRAYGSFATIFGPYWTIPVVTIIILWRWSLKMNPSKIRCLPAISALREEFFR